jgi:solute carrier family 25 citrate transporter 1
VTIIRETLRTQGIRGLYAGCTALVVGNSVKAGVRFVSYDKFKQALADKDVSSISFPATTITATIIYP